IEACKRRRRMSQTAQRKTDEVVHPAVLRVRRKSLSRQLDAALKLTLPARRLCEAEERIGVGNGSGAVHWSSLSATRVHPAIGERRLLEFSRRMREKCGSGHRLTRGTGQIQDDATTCHVACTNTRQNSIDRSLYLESSPMTADGGTSHYISAQDGLKLHVRAYGNRREERTPVVCLP